LPNVWQSAKVAVSLYHQRNTNTRAMKTVTYSVLNAWLKKYGKQKASEMMQAALQGSEYRFPANLTFEYDGTGAWYCMFERSNEKGTYNTVVLREIIN
jgi:hypothetical protein